METVKKRKKIFITQNIAEQMWSAYVTEKKRTEKDEKRLIEDLKEMVNELTDPETTAVSIINNKALLNELNKRTGLDLKLNTCGLKAEISDKENCHIIYSVSVTNLLEPYKYADKEEFPDGVNLQVFRYEIW